MERPFLDTLTERLAAALSADELERATRPPDGAGVARSFGPGHLRIDGRLVAHHVPRVTLAVDPPADARELCAAWAIAEPVAVSPDVEQRTWQLCVAGRELSDPYARRIASDPITAGRWDVVAYLTGRPAGGLPGVVSGASPAYDVRERGGAVRSIEITPTAHVTRAREPGHADVRALLGVMATAHPAWRGSGAGWTPDPAATFVVIYESGAPAAGGALSPAPASGAARASQVCVAPDRRGAYLGAALLDTLEALARGQGAAALRLDSSAFLLGDALPLTRSGYAIEPAYAGGADVEVWAAKELSHPSDLD
jgi:GNAT superfamily N-acetyltransferase